MVVLSFQLSLVFIFYGIPTRSLRSVNSNADLTQSNWKFFTLLLWKFIIKRCNYSYLSVTLMFLSINQSAILIEVKKRSREVLQPRRTLSLPTQIAFSRRYLIWLSAGLCNTHSVHHLAFLKKETNISLFCVVFYINSILVKFYNFTEIYTCILLVAHFHPHICIILGTKLNNIEQEIHSE